MLEIVSGQGWLQRSLGQIFCLGMDSSAVGLQTRGEDDGLGSVSRKNISQDKCEQKEKSARDVLWRVTLAPCLTGVLGTRTLELSPWDKGAAPPSYQCAPNG